jgi:mitochondrial fission protein ELM1
MEGSHIFWLLLDGKPGHETQSLGLAEAISSRVPCKIHRLCLQGDRGWLARVRSAMRAAATLPAPDFIIAAGHATHLPLLWLARRHRARSIVLMKPSLPPGWFDVCIAPEHDFPNGGARDNIVLTRGALNRVTPASGEKMGKLVLLGGPSKTHGWDGPALLEMLAKVTTGSGWHLTDSRRTPVGFLEQIREKLPGLSAISHRDTPPGWVAEQLRQAGNVWVTEDSVSMVYEALTSGANVGLLPVPRRVKESRVLKGIDSLLRDGYLTPFERWLTSGDLAPPPERLDEAGRCAALLVKQFGLADAQQALHGRGFR